MPLDFQSQVGPIGPLSFGAPAYLRSGDFGEQIMLANGGEYQELTRRGYVFTARSGAAAAIPVPATTGVCPSLWNQASSGKLVIPLYINVSPATINTPVLTAFTLTTVPNAGDAALAAAPVVTFTNIAPTSNLVGSTLAARTRFANATCTYLATQTMLMDLGGGHYLEGAAATGYQGTWQFELKGTVVLKPGNVLCLNAIAATSTTFWTSIIFAELPMPSNVS
jgi:hypothetical protein